MSALTAPYTSYAHYLTTIRREWPEYEWIIGFLYPVAEPQGAALLVDIESNKVKRSSWYSAQDSRFITDIERNLTTASVQIRIIAIQYPDGKLVNKSWLDFIALRFDIDPLFLHSHFAYTLRMPNTIELLPSKKPFFEFGYQGPYHASVLFLTDIAPAHQTVFVLIHTARGDNPRSGVQELERPSIYDSPPSIRKIGKGKNLLRRYQAVIDTWDTEEIRFGNQFPFSFIQPLVRFVAMEIACHMHETFQGFEEEKEHALHSDGSLAGGYEFSSRLFLEAVEMDHSGLKKSVDSLQRLLSRFELDNALPTNWKSTLNDYKHLLQKTEEWIAAYNAFDTRRLGLLSFQKALKGVEQADSVKRLTTLAFIFIPLSLITSFFGMNVSELGSGSVPMWVFAAASICVLVLALVFLIMWSALSSWFDQVGKGLWAIRARKEIIKKIFTISPSAAIWLVLFAFQYPPSVFQLFLVELGIWGVLGLGSDWDPPKFNDPHGSSSLRHALSPFWTRRGNQILEITQRRGWEKTVWWRRLREKLRQQQG